MHYKFFKKMFRKNNQQQQKNIGYSPQSTPTYIRRQLDQLAHQQQPTTQIMAPTSSAYDKISVSKQSPLPIEKSLTSTVDLAKQLEQYTPVAMPPFFRNELRETYLTEGTDAILQCNVVGVPRPKACCD